MDDMSSVMELLLITKILYNAQKICLVLKAKLSQNFLNNIVHSLHKAQNFFFFLNLTMVSFIRYFIRISF